ncbi:MAG: hypothetical protein QXQ02_03185 [Halobacteria archaeon]
MKVLPSYEFRVRTTKRDFSRMLDGKIYLLERGKDYTCKDVSLAGQVRLAAKRRGLRVKIGRHKDGVVVQAVKE